jgi:hypothetical protein
LWELSVRMPSLTENTRPPPGKRTGTSAPTPKYQSQCWSSAAAHPTRRRSCRSRRRQRRPGQVSRRPAADRAARADAHAGWRPPRASVCVRAAQKWHRTGASRVRHGRTWGMNARGACRPASSSARRAKESGVWICSTRGAAAGPTRCTWT